MRGAGLGNAASSPHGSSSMPVSTSSSSQSANRTAVVMPSTLLQSPGCCPMTARVTQSSMLLLIALCREFGTAWQCARSFFTKAYIPGIIRSYVSKAQHHRYIINSTYSYHTSTDMSGWALLRTRVSIITRQRWLV